MANQKIQVIGPLMQSTSQVITLSKNSEYTQTSTDGRTLTAYLYDEDSFQSMTGGVDVTVGVQSGQPADTDITLTIDTLTGITLSGRTERWALHVVDSNGEQLVPNKVTGDTVFLLLQKVPA